MRKRLLTILLVVCALLIAGSAWASYPMRVRDVRGRTIVIKSRPMRVVSIAPSNTEILFALGLKDRIVGVTRYCDYPTAAKKKTKVGDMNVSTEAVVALKPDLILAHATINSAIIPKLERLGLTVFAIDPKTMGETARDIRCIGRITARPRTADKVAGKIEAAIKHVKLASAKKTSRKVLVVIQSNPLWAAGPKTFVDEMLKISGAKNVAFDAKAGFVPFSRELAISRNPDVIITGLKSDIAFFGKSPEWRTTNAVKHNRVYYINSDLLLRAGPRLAEGVNELASRVGH